MSNATATQIQSAQTSSAAPSQPTPQPVAQPLASQTNSSPPPVPLQNLNQNAPAQTAATQNHASQIRSRWLWLKARCPDKRQTAFIGYITLLAALIGLGPGFQGAKYGIVSAKVGEESLELDKWQAKATFQQWCQDEVDAGRTMSVPCMEAINQPLQPPPTIKRSITPGITTDPNDVVTPGLMEKFGPILGFILSVLRTLVNALFFCCPELFEPVFDTLDRCWGKLGHHLRFSSDDSSKSHPKAARQRSQATMAVDSLLQANVEGICLSSSSMAPSIDFAHENEAFNLTLLPGLADDIDDLERYDVKTLDVLNGIQAVLREDAIENWLLDHGIKRSEILKLVRGVDTMTSHENPRGEDKAWLWKVPYSKKKSKQLRRLLRRVLSSSVHDVCVCGWSTCRGGLYVELLEVLAGTIDEKSYSIERSDVVKYLCDSPSDARCLLTEISRHNSILHVQNTSPVAYLP